MNRMLGALSWGVVLALSGASIVVGDDKLERYESTQIEMGVPFKIILYAPDEAAAKGAMQAAFSRIAGLNAVLSDYDAQSELSRLSATSGSNMRVPVGDDLWAVLARSQALAEQTGGAFDITVGPYVRLWRRARRQKELPDPERMEAARTAVGFRHLVLDNKEHSAQLAAENMRLDLGGIAMGYAVDESLAVLRSLGITRALIDASGDIGVGDPPPSKHGWIIGVIPLSADGTPTRELSLTNAAVTTSGDAFQHVVIDGRRYSHIVNPKTGLGLTDQSGVTVVAKDCMTADSLATTVSVLGPEAGLKLVETVPGAAAFIVRNTGAKIETFESRRFQTYESHTTTP